MTAFARPPAEGNAEELRVCAWSYTAGWNAAADVGRVVLVHLRDQLDAAQAEIARRDAEDQAAEDAYATHVRAGNRGDTRGHLEVLLERAERSGHPELYAAEVATAQRHTDRVWSGWHTHTTSPVPSPRRAA